MLILKYHKYKYVFASLTTLMCPNEKLLLVGSTKLTHKVKQEQQRFEYLLLLKEY